MSACVCQGLKKNKVVDYDDDELDVLIIGLEGAGKTLLIRRLQSRYPALATSPSNIVYALS
eukprot:1160465-Pelagomonas_calceolata.AAC.9